MKLRTKLSIPQSNNEINYQGQLFLLGSCFVNNIGRKLNYFKFRSHQNPFGILFHPLAIENLVSKAVQKHLYTEDDIFFANERWHCFDAHSELSHPSKEKLLEKLNGGLEKTNQQIHESTHILITLGTAWVYKSKTSKLTVANCHKAPQKEFSKELLSINDIESSLRNIIELVQSVNENAHFIFTISPVRHLKDGFIENQRSKSHLISAVHEFLSFRAESRNCTYFPSYELMMDELRDYRFYDTDMIHPNQIAIDYIWEKFKEVWISSKARPTMEKVDTIQKGLQHRPFNPESEQHKAFLASLDEKIMYLQEEYPFIKF